MKNKWVLQGVLIAMSLAGCSKNSIDYDHIVFSKDELIQSSFGGLGVEWGVYEEILLLLKVNQIHCLNSCLVGKHCIFDLLQKKSLLLSKFFLHYL